MAKSESDMVKLRNEILALIEQAEDNRRLYKVCSENAIFCEGEIIGLNRALRTIHIFL
jgi:hypothetical protein